ncbi:50S ribosomal protein L11 methyltransferase [Bacillus sp. FJAT-45350]|uniref:50S ribosomal protein L11 methyltransferase n=1 Tax=Bacillus sp. FJAT-45350 TaxID=2011014 RepID=UPI0015CE2828|nr:50S ribosomal protein L11 methyltransferase [Bacillus sp. FJAT-45350]
MLHEFVVCVPLDKVDFYVEKLNAVGITYLYYDIPFEVTKDDNGYGVDRKEVELIDLKIYAEEGQVPNLPETYFGLIEKEIAFGQKEVAYQVIKDEGWEQSFEDIDLGNGWVIVYPDSVNEYDDKRVIKVDPQGAFGTGIHETTQDCLRMIIKHMDEGVSVLDLGTGSGILSIGAALKGAKKILAVDIEPVEREIEHQSKLNRVSSIEIVQADLLQHDDIIQDNHDWIFINIGANETVGLVKQHKLLDKGTNFLVSGIVEWNEDKVKDLFATCRLIVRKQTNEWITLLFSKR